MAPNEIVIIYICLTTLLNLAFSIMWRTNSVLNFLFKISLIILTVYGIGLILNILMRCGALPQ